MSLPLPSTAQIPRVPTHTPLFEILHPPAVGIPLLQAQPPSKDQLGEEATRASQASEPRVTCCWQPSAHAVPSARLSRWHVWHPGLLSVDAGESQRERHHCSRQGYTKASRPGTLGAPNIDTRR